MRGRGGRAGGGWKHMDRLPIELKELVLRRVHVATLLKVRRMSREWRHAADGELHRRYYLPMCAYLSSMRVRYELLPKRLLLRYAMSPSSSERVYKCSRCGHTYCGAFMSCDCKERDRKLRAHAKQSCVAVVILACVTGGAVRLHARRA